MSERAIGDQRPKSWRMVIAVTGDGRVFERYGVMLVSLEPLATVKAAHGQRFVDPRRGHDGQRTIAPCRLNGQQFFFPNATHAGIGL